MVGAMLTLRVLSIRSMTPPDAHEVVVDGIEATIGRAPGNLLALTDDPAISRVHAKVIPSGDLYLLRDLSANGTVLQRHGKKSDINQEETALENGDLIKIGEYLIAVELATKPAEASPLQEPSIRAQDQPEVQPFPWPDSGEDPFNWPQDIHKPADPFAPRQPALAASAAEGFESSGLAVDPFMDLLNHFAESSSPYEPSISPAGSFEAGAKPLMEASAAFNAPTPTRPVNDNDALIAAFFDGSGLPFNPEDFQETETKERFMHHLGRLMRVLAEEGRKSASARAAVKRELHLDVTQLRSRNNNPLKFCSSNESALRGLLGLEAETYIDGESAIQEIFTDQLEQQLAIQAALQASVQTMLRSFEPEALLKEQPESGSLFSIKGKAWDHYVEAYPRLVENALKNIYGEVFRSVYEQQIAILKNREV